MYILKSSSMYNQVMWYICLHGNSISIMFFSPTNIWFYIPKDFHVNIFITQPIQQRLDVLRNVHIFHSCNCIAQIQIHMLPRNFTNQRSWTCENATMIISQILHNNSSISSLPFDLSDIRTFHRYISNLSSNTCWYFDEHTITTQNANNSEGIQCHTTNQTNS